MSIFPENGSSGNLVVRSWNGTPISRRTTDGYVNATAMCKANKKRWSDYRESDRCQLYLDALSQTTGIPVFDLIQSRQGHGGGTWVHPQVAVDLARWIDAPFAVWMDGWFLESANQQMSQVRDTRPVLSSEQQALEWLMSWSQRFGVKLDDRDMLQLKNHAMSLALPPSGQGQSVYNDIPISRAVYEQFRVQLPIKQLAKIGRLIAAMFRSEFKQDPPCHDQYVDGANRSVAHYDRAWLVDALRRLHDENPSLFCRSK